MSEHTTAISVEAVATVEHPPVESMTPEQREHLGLDPAKDKS